MIIDLRTQEGYNIASAMRGPDNEGAWLLKGLLTAPIRIMAGVDSATGAASNWHSWAMPESKLLDTLEHWAGREHHYQSHVVRATQEFNRLGIEGAKGFLAFVEPYYLNDRLRWRPAARELHQFALKAIGETWL